MALKTPIEKVATKVATPSIEVDSQTPRDDCVEIVEDAKGELTDVSHFIEDDDWDQALETLELVLGDLVGLRDAILEAQQKGT